MILPKFTIEISIETFETNFEYFFSEFISTKNLTNLNLHKKGVGYNGHRYIIKLGSKEAPNSLETKIGEIDVIPTHRESITIRAAVFNFEKYEESVTFFEDFYDFLFSTWDVYSEEEIDRSNIVLDKWFNIGKGTGYFYIEDVFHDMKKLIRDLYKCTFDSGGSFYEEDLFKATDTEREQIFDDYKSIINEGLPQNFLGESSGNKFSDKIHEKTRMRAQRIKEIKDEHPHWSQDIVVSDYNKKFKGDDYISISDLQNAYRAMGWKWQRADRIS